jgi:hypothetical protein
VAAVNDRLVRALSHAAARAIPITVRLVTPSGCDREFRDVLVAEVGVDFAIVRTRRDRRRLVVRFAALRAVERLDGRPFDPRPRDARAELAERGEEMVDAGGLE